MAFKRCLGDVTQGSLTADQQVRGNLQVTAEDMKLAFRQVRPSAMREVAVDVPKVESLISGVMVANHVFVAKACFCL